MKKEVETEKFKTQKVRKIQEKWHCQYENSQEIENRGELSPLTDCILLLFLRTRSPFWYERKLWEDFPEFVQWDAWIFDHKWLQITGSEGKSDWRGQNSGKGNHTLLRSDRDWPRVGVTEIMQLFGGQCVYKFGILKKKRQKATGKFDHKIHPNWIIFTFVYFSIMATTEEGVCNFYRILARSIWRSHPPIWR